MNELENPGKSLQLADFPLPLRKVALVYAQATQYLTFTKACEIAGVEPKAAQKQYERYRKKGKDLRNLISQNSIKEMWNNVGSVDRSVTNEAIGGSPRHANLYYKRLGILKDSPLVTVDFKSVTVVATPASIPASVARVLPAEELGEIEIEGPPKQR